MGNEIEKLQSMQRSSENEWLISECQNQEFKMNVYGFTRNEKCDFEIWIQSKNL